MKNIELLDSVDPSQIKAAFFDVDGTLVNKDYAISQQTRHAIAQLIKQNITVSLATGRPYFGATHILIPFVKDYSRYIELDQLFPSYLETRLPE